MYTLAANMSGLAIMYIAVDLLRRCGYGNLGRKAGSGSKGFVIAW